VAHVVDRAVADGAVEDRVLLGLHVGSADDRVPLVDVGDDLLDLARRVAELLERHRHGLVDDRDLPAADELLRLDEREVRLHARRVAVHHEADRVVADEAVGDVGDVVRNREVVGRLVIECLDGRDRVVVEAAQVLELGVGGALEERRRRPP